MKCCNSADENAQLRVCTEPQKMESRTPDPRMREAPTDQFQFRYRLNVRIRAEIRGSLSLSSPQAIKCAQRR